jgi:hypothetical protein
VRPWKRRLSDDERSVLLSELLLRHPELVAEAEEITSTLLVVEDDQELADEITAKLRTLRASGPVSVDTERGRILDVLQPYIGDLMWRKERGARRVQEGEVTAPVVAVAGGRVPRVGVVRGELLLGRWALVCRWIEDAAALRERAAAAPGEDRNGHVRGSRALPPLYLGGRGNRLVARSRHRPSKRSSVNTQAAGCPPAVTG